VRYDQNETYKVKPLKDLLGRNFDRAHMVDLLRHSVSKGEATSYLYIIFITKILIKCGDAINNEAIRIIEIEYKRKIEEVNQVMKAKNEFNRSVNENAEVLPQGFRQIYQLTSDDDLRRFNFMYSSNEDKSVSEKTEIGLILMEKGNSFRKDLKGQSKTFETSEKNKVTIYFPKSDDNISDGRYSYPRAAIHTAIELSKSMMNNKMVSALGLSIGWGGMIEEANYSTFIAKMNTREEDLMGYDKIKNSNFIMYLVTIPRVRPHKYLELTHAEALIFIIFSMMNDMVINISLQKTNPNLPLKSNFTADTISKLSNMGLNFDNLERYSKAIAFATKVCVKNIKRKGIIPHHAAKIIKGMLELGKKIMVSPHLFENDDIIELENVFLTASDLQSIAGRTDQTSSDLIA